MSTVDGASLDVFSRLRNIYLFSVDKSLLQRYVTIAANYFHVPYYTIGVRLSKGDCNIMR